MPFASQVGKWDPTFLSDGVAAVHAHLLNNGKVFFHDWYDVDNYRLWDPAVPLVFVPVPAPPQPGDLTRFCSGHSFLPNGHLLIAGGGPDPALGLKDAVIYNPFGNNPPPTDPWWTELPGMNDYRWYPTCTTLATGEVLVTSGLKRNLQFNDIPQVLQYPNLTWRNLVSLILDVVPIYPWMHVLPDGRVFHAGSRRAVCQYLNTAGSGSWDPDGPTRIGPPDREFGTSVMYRPGKVIAIGGGPSGALPTNTAEHIDLMATDPPVWQSAGTMAHRRRHPNATLLANGDVLVTGGTAAVGPPFPPHSEGDDPVGAVFAAERWRLPTGPAPGTWSLMASWPDAIIPPPYYRGYHSTALLLPDGKVLSGGGNIPPGNCSMEIFSPPYLFLPNSDTLAPRAVIDTVAPANYNALFNVVMLAPPPNPITRVTLVRPSSVTHSVNMDQRFVELRDVTQDGVNVQVRAPANSMEAPPGYYLLFLIDNTGVPSVARFIHLS